MYSAFECTDPEQLTMTDRFNMDLVTVTGYKSVASLMADDGGMDNFEWQCWMQYWKENLFGPFANNYMTAQQSACALYAFGGGSFEVDKFMLKLRDEGKEVESDLIRERKEEEGAYNMMVMFKGKEAADKWRGLKNANN